MLRVSGKGWVPLLPGVLPTGAGRQGLPLGPTFLHAHTFGDPFYSSLALNWAPTVFFQADSVRNWKWPHAPGCPPRAAFVSVLTNLQANPLVIILSVRVGVA